MWPSANDYGWAVRWRQQGLKSQRYICLPLKSPILKELGETLLSGPPSASFVMDHNKELWRWDAALIGPPIKVYGLICGALPDHQKEAKRGWWQMKMFGTLDAWRASTLQPFLTTTALQQLRYGRSGGGWNLWRALNWEQCDIVNRHFISTLLAAV